MIKFNKKYFKHMVNESDKIDLEQGISSPSNIMRTNVKFMDLIDSIMKDDERLTWDEFIARCNLVA